LQWWHFYATPICVMLVEPCERHRLRLRGPE
jgi:hypothetical protein